MVHGEMTAAATATQPSGAISRDRRGRRALHSTTTAGTRRSTPVLRVKAAKPHSAPQSNADLILAPSRRYASMASTLPSSSGTNSATEISEALSIIRSEERRVGAEG